MLISFRSPDVRLDLAAEVLAARMMEGAVETLEAGSCHGGNLAKSPETKECDDERAGTSTLAHCRRLRGTGGPGHGALTIGRVLASYFTVGKDGKYSRQCGCARAQCSGAHCGLVHLRSVSKITCSKNTDSGSKASNVNVRDSKPQQATTAIRRPPLY